MVLLWLQPLRVAVARKIRLLALAAVVLGFNSVSPAQSISLDGNWQFVPDPGGKLGPGDLASTAGSRPVEVPGSWQTQFADLRDYAGVAWYWRSFSAPALTPGRTALIHFGAVDYRAEVYINGKKAGQHEGGYLPFDVDAGSLLHAGDNQLAVRVTDAGATRPEVDGIRYPEIPHGKQNWYVETSGLWQSVELDVRPGTRIGTLHVQGGADGRFDIDILILNAGSGGPNVSASAPGYAGAQIRDASGAIVWRESINLVAGATHASFHHNLSNPQLWSPATPYLYKVEGWTSSGDSASTNFGFRTFETRAGRFFLNGQPIYLRGALDQDFYADSGYVPPSYDFILQEMEKAKALGLNLLRCHIKVPDPRYLEAADAAGVLVWYEIPNFDKLTPDSERRADETIQGMIARDWSHPSIIAVSLINESWGADLKQEHDRQWLKQFYARVKPLVPGWLVDDNSACCDNFHMASDLADFHTYDSIPDHAGDFDSFVADFAGRPNWLWSPNNDAQVKPDAPLMLSEFGNWGLPHVPDPPPWWFDRDFGGREITRPGGWADRFRESGADSVFRNLDALSDATEEHEYGSLKYEIESLRSHPEIQGYVITEFTDIQWESNGLLDMWRRPKAFHDRLAKLQTDDLIVARIAKRNFASGEHAHADLFFSHYSGENLNGANVRWSLEGFGDTYGTGLHPMERGTTVAAGSVDFTVPAVSAPVKRTLTFQVEAGDKVFSANSLDLYFFPPRADELRPAVNFEDPGGRLRRLAEAMRGHGYLEPSGQEALPVLVTSTLNNRTEEVLSRGGRVILIGSDKQTVAPGIEIVPRAGSDLDGNWISNFLWLRKDHPVFHGIGFDAMPGFEAQAATPPAVIQGLPGSAGADILAGMSYGWLHSNSGVLLQARAGKGKLLVTTFGFATAYEVDPYATTLLDNLVKYAVSDFEPKFEIPVVPGAH
jgi:hypothetical protein